MKTMTIPIQPGSDTSNFVVRQRLEGDYVTCMEWVRPHEAHERHRKPGHCMTLVPLVDGQVPERCPYNHVLPWYGTETG